MYDLCNLRFLSRDENFSLCEICPLRKKDVVYRNVNLESWGNPLKFRKKKLMKLCQFAPGKIRE